MPLTRVALAGLAAGVILAGCADKPVKPAARPTPVVQASAASASGARPPAGAARDAIAVDPSLPATTGIPACEDYLASYRACHRAAGVYAPDQIDIHYRQMRQSLMRDSLKPDIRPQLAARCNWLAVTLRQALHGKACMPDPANMGTNGAR
ncbi:MAG TPA: hypothetical protein VFW82_11495 [Dyella sp.]|nr:hypothetical protein [Dyella sp.]